MLSKLLRLLAFVKVRPGQQQTFYASVERARNDLIPIFRKLGAGQIQTDM